MQNFDKKEYRALKAMARDNGVKVGYLADTLTVAYKPCALGPDARMVAVAVSYCAPEDEFRKKIGKYQALNKLYNGQAVQLPLAAYLNEVGNAEFKDYLTSVLDV